MPDVGRSPIAPCVIFVSAGIASLTAAHLTPRRGGNFIGSQAQLVILPFLINSSKVKAVGVFLLLFLSYIIIIIIIT